jgi:hypothetical protein
VRLSPVLRSRRVRLGIIRVKYEMPGVGVDGRLCFGRRPGRQRPERTVGIGVLPCGEIVDALKNRLRGHEVRRHGGELGGQGGIRRGERGRNRILEGGRIHAVMKARNGCRRIRRIVVAVVIDRQSLPKCGIRRVGEHRGAVPHGMVSPV